MGRPTKKRNPTFPVNRIYSAGTVLSIIDQRVWDNSPSNRPRFLYEVECSKCGDRSSLRKIDQSRHFDNPWFCKSCARNGSRNPMFGLSNPCTSERRENIRKSRFEMWERPEYRENRPKRRVDSGYERYRLEVWKYTQRNDLSVLDGYEKRGKMKCGTDNTNLDHIYSIKDGYENQVPAEIVGNIVNLRFVHWKENRDKGDCSSITKEELHERFNKAGEAKPN